MTAGYHIPTNALRKAYSAVFLAIQVAHVAGPVDSAMGGGLLSGVE